MALQPYNRLNPNHLCIGTVAFPFAAVNDCNPCAAALGGMDGTGGTGSDDLASTLKSLPLYGISKLSTHQQAISTFWIFSTSHQTTSSSSYWSMGAPFPVNA